MSGFGVRKKREQEHPRASASIAKNKISHISNITHVYNVYTTQGRVSFNKLAVNIYDIYFIFYIYIYI
jgi:hypothetical protein